MPGDTAVIRPSASIDVEAILGADAPQLLGHECKTIPKSTLHLPGPDHVEQIWLASDRPIRVLTSLQSAARPRPPRAARATFRSCPSIRASSTPPARRSRRTPRTSIPRTSSSWRIEGGCNAVASTLGVLGIVARKYAHKIPFLLKLNHNEFLSYPNSFDQIQFASVKQAFDMGAMGVGATIYFGSEESKRQIQEVTEMFQHAHELGMFTVLWCYLRNAAFKTKDTDYHVAADLTGQANHLGVTIEADIIKQKLPENNGGYTARQLRQDAQEGLLGSHDATTRST